MPRVDKRIDKTIVNPKITKVNSQSQKRAKKDVSHYVPMWTKSEKFSSLEQSFVDLSILYCPDLIWNKEGFQWRFSHNWSFDFVLMENLEEISPLKIVVECEGLYAQKIFVKGRNRSFSSKHLRPVGYTGNCHKYNQALLEGWSILRYTSIDFNPKHIDFNPFRMFEQIKALIELKKKWG